MGLSSFFFNSVEHHWHATPVISKKSSKALPGEFTYLSFFLGSEIWNGERKLCRNSDLNRCPTGFLYSNETHLSAPCQRLGSQWALIFKVVTLRSQVLVPEMWLLHKFLRSLFIWHIKITDFVSFWTQDYHILSITFSSPVLASKGFWWFPKSKSLWHEDLQLLRPFKRMVIYLEGGDMNVCWTPVTHACFE